MEVDPFADLRAGREKYHILELGAGDYSKSAGLASRFAYAFDSLSVYDAFDYTSTELADVPENRLIQKLHLVEQGNISSSRSRSRNSLESTMHFMGGVDGTHLERVQPLVKSDLILWQAPHTGVHGNNLSFIDPRQSLVRVGERFYIEHQKEFDYPEKSTRGDFSTLQNEVMSNIGLMVGLFNSAHSKISRQLDEEGKPHTGKIALVVLNSIPFKGNTVYMPTAVAEQCGWCLVQAGSILEYQLERTNTGQIIDSKSGASLLIFEESKEYLSQLSKKDFDQHFSPEKIKIEQLIIGELGQYLNILPQHMFIFPSQHQPIIFPSDIWNQEVSSTHPRWQVSDVERKEPAIPKASTMETEQEPKSVQETSSPAMDVESSSEPPQQNSGRGNNPF